MKGTAWIAALACGLAAAAPVRAEQGDAIEGASVGETASVPLIAGRIEDGVRLVAGPVAALRYDPLGRFTGYILEDGTSVGLIPEQANLHAWGFARPGEPLLVEYRNEEVLRIVNHATGRTLDFGNASTQPLWAVERAPSEAPTGVGGGPAAEPGERDLGDEEGRADVQGLERMRRLRATGEVHSVIRSAEGNALGVRLTGGTQVFLLPRVAAVLDGVQPGDRLQITGRGTQNERSASLWAGKIVRLDATGATQSVLLDLGRGDGAPELDIGPTGT